MSPTLVRVSGSTSHIALEAMVVAVAVAEEMEERVEKGKREGEEVVRAAE